MSSASRNEASNPSEASLENMYLFGGNRPWDASHFTASDDRVRGGKSQSYLTVLPGNPAPEGSRSSVPAPATRAEFSGHLDITALGGAGFASQRTADDFPSPPWDVSGYDALVLDVDAAGAAERTRAKKDKKYTVTLKDEILPRRPDGRDQSTVSWEYDFVVGGPGSGTGGEKNVVVVIPFKDFKPTYRGRPKPDAEPLDLSALKRLSFMMRSFFGDQEGDFSIVFNSVSVQKSSEDESELQPSSSAETTRADNEGGGLTSWLSKLLGWGG